MSEQERTERREKEKKTGGRKSAGARTPAFAASCRREPAAHSKVLKPKKAAVVPGPSDCPVNS